MYRIEWTIRRIGCVIEGVTFLIIFAVNARKVQKEGPEGQAMEPLGVWLILVGLMRLSSVWFGFFDIWALRLAVFPEMTDIHGRTFATWTLLTCTLCFMTAPTLQRNKPLYITTFLSFVYALAHFLIEYFIFKSMPIRGLATTGFFAGTSIIWMLWQWNKSDAPESLKEA